MGETLVRKQNIDFYVKEEPTAGTLVTGALTTTDAIRLTEDDVDLNLNRDLIPSGYITGSLGASAPQPGMWADDLGGQVGFYARGGSSTPQPDENVFLKCLFGSEQPQTADTVVAGTLTTDQFSVTTPASFGAGELIRVQTAPTVFSVAKVLSVASPLLNVWPPLTESPAATDPIQAAYSYLLLDSGHPTMSVYSYMEGTKRLAYAGCRPRSLQMTFEVGQKIPMIYSFSGLTPYFDYTSDPTSPAYQTSPNPLITLGIGVTWIFADIAYGTPSTTSTILTTPSHETYGATVGDDIMIDVGAGVWETVNIESVSGNAGENQTITHAAVSVAASEGDTVYIKRNTACAQMGASFDLTLEYEWLPINCITAAYGKQSSTYGRRTITMNKNAYFRSWEEFERRDNVVGAELMVIAGDTANNIMALYASNVINTEPSLAFDELVMNPTAMQAVRGTMSGNESELTLAYF